MIAPILHFDYTTVMLHYGYEEDRSAPMVKDRTAQLDVLMFMCVGLEKTVLVLVALIK